MSTNPDVEEVRARNRETASPYHDWEPVTEALTVRCRSCRGVWDTTVFRDSGPFVSRIGVCQPDPGLSTEAGWAK